MHSGKSSLLNALALPVAPPQGAHALQPLAKCSATPGRTQTINFYGASAGGQRALDNRRPNHETFRLVDLPGYGPPPSPRPPRPLCRQRLTLAEQAMPLRP